MTVVKVTEICEGVEVSTTRCVSGNVVRFETAIIVHDTFDDNIGVTFNEFNSKEVHQIFVDRATQQFAGMKGA